jgi:two-component system chemotaxis sensor kinase CheA
VADEPGVETYRAAFREEAREILVDLESALLELSDAPEDQELVGRAFRGLHTIKGSGAMFGFEKLAAFTHRLETAFDEVRCGRLSVSDELVDLTLAALDQIKGMLEEPVGVTTANSAEAEDILFRLERLTGTAHTAEAEDPVAVVAGAAASTATASASGMVNGATRSNWKIHFHPGPQLMTNGGNPQLLLRELRQLGDLHVKASMAAVPPLKELEPERCYVGWEMELATAAEREAIRDVFIFVEDCCDLSIEPMRGAEAAADGASQETSLASNPDAAACAADLTAKGLDEPRLGAGRRAYDKPDNVTSLRVPAVKLDQFVDLVGELVTVQARLSEIAARLGDLDVGSVSEEIERLTSALRENSMNIRMMPIRGTFERFRRLVHDLARDLGKDVELTMEGADTELDKTVIDQLADPLMHLIRNSMDHGIEPPEVRRAEGKRAAATIHLSARHAGANVLVTVADDGGGINADAVRTRAVERGLISADAQLSENDTYGLIFEAGFSTAEQVTDISGRGVGMDVVRQRVEALRGTIDISSKRGQGTKVGLRLPLTLAIIDGLLVRVGDSYFVLPLSNILECIELTSEDIKNSNGKHVSIVRGEIVPYIRLRDHFQIAPPRPEIEQIMIAETEEGRYGFVVDEVLGDYQTVIKSLGRFYRHVQVVSGATILGNGIVALIVDPHRVVQDVLRQQTESQRSRAVSPSGARPASATARERLASSVLTAKD